MYAPSVHWLKSTQCVIAMPSHTRGRVLSGLHSARVCCSLAAVFLGAHTRYCTRTSLSPSPSRVCVTCTVCVCVCVCVRAHHTTGVTHCMRPVLTCSSTLTYLTLACSSFIQHCLHSDTCVARRGKASYWPYDYPWLLTTLIRHTAGPGAGISTSRTHTDTDSAPCNVCFICASYVSHPLTSVLSCDVTHTARTAPRIRKGKAAACSAAETNTHTSTRVCPSQHTNASYELTSLIARCACAHTLCVCVCVCVCLPHVYKLHQAVTVRTLGIPCEPVTHTHTHAHTHVHTHTHVPTVSHSSVQY